MRFSRREFAMTTLSPALLKVRPNQSWESFFPPRPGLRGLETACDVTVPSRHLVRVANAIHFSRDNGSSLNIEGYIYNSVQ